jgi:hypothetical protein
LNKHKIWAMMRLVREGWEGRGRLEGVSVGFSLLVVLLLQLFLPARSLLPCGRAGPFSRSMSNREQVSHGPRLVRCDRQRNGLQVKMAWEDHSGLPDAVAAHHFWTPRQSLSGLPDAVAAAAPAPKVALSTLVNAAQSKDQ